ncbi:MAG: hypothetical protein OEY49_11950, partial [Candidatus Heimdallarchaeota archaeon]|nr:hypothetical protein [Candidatus Heimdallarchaeota archaeon]
TNCLVRGSPHLHAKFVIVDPFSNAKGMLLTSNITTEALTRNPEFAVILNNYEIKELFEAFRYAFWEEADYELQDKKWARINKKSTPNFTKWNSISSTIHINNDLQNKMIELIEKSNGDLHIGAYKISINTKLWDKIVNYANNNRVFVYTRLHRDNQAVYEKLSLIPNVTIISSKYLHAKFLITKNDVYITTANFNEMSFDNGFEVGIHLADIKEGIRIIENWKDNLEYVFVREMSIYDIESEEIYIYNPSKNTNEKITLLGELEKKENITAESIDEFLKWQDKDISVPKFNYEKIINVNLTIDPPTLPNKCVKIRNLNEIRNKKLRDLVKDLFDKNDKTKYDLYLDKDKPYLQVKTKMDFEKLKEKIPKEIKIVF